MSVEPLDHSDIHDTHSQHPNGVNGGGHSPVRHSHGGHMVSNMAHDSVGAEKSGNGIKGAFVSVVSPITDPLWYRGANAFSTRKTVICSLINIALLTSTAGQLKSLLRITSNYPFYNSLLGMLIVCILAEIAIGILLFFIGRLNLNRVEQRSQAELLQNIIMGICVVVLILHIMNTAFGIEELGCLLPTTPRPYYTYPAYNAATLPPPTFPPPTAPPSTLPPVLFFFNQTAG